MDLIVPTTSSQRALSGPGGESTISELSHLGLSSLAVMRAAGAKEGPVPETLREAGAGFLPRQLAYGVSEAVGGYPSLVVPRSTRLRLSGSNGTRRLDGAVGVSPFHPRPSRVLALASEGPQTMSILVSIDYQDLSPPPSDSRAVARLKGVEVASIHDEGASADSGFARIELWERLGLIGVALGLIDRSYTTAHEALNHPTPELEELATNQSLLTSLAELDRIRATVELVAYDMLRYLELAESADLWIHTAHSWVTEASTSATSMTSELCGILRPDLESDAQEMHLRAMRLARTLYAQAAEWSRAASLLAQGGVL